MQVILEHETENAQGPLVISDGQLLRIGRQLTTRKDLFMSGLYFTIECNEGRCCISDMNNCNGTFVNGTGIQKAVLHHGDVITAGYTKLRMRIEEAPENYPLAQCPSLPPDWKRRLWC